jgi:hypothetical protein
MSYTFGVIRLHLSNHFAQEQKGKEKTKEIPKTGGISTIDAAMLGLVAVTCSWAADYYWSARSSGKSASIGKEGNHFILFCATR